MVDGSNAAVRSRRMRMLRLPESEERRRSLVILRRAVSVLCFVRNPDRKGSNRLLELRWDFSWEATTRSSSFDRKGRFEMGRKLDMMSGVSPGLFSMGVTAASLSEGGTDPEQREELLIVVMSWEMGGRHSLTNCIGMGSRVQVEFIPPIRADSCIGVTGENRVRGCEVKGGSQEGRWGGLLRRSG